MTVSNSNDDRDTRRDQKGGEPFNASSGYSGQDYHRERERLLGAKRPSGEVDPAANRQETDDGVSIPAEAGRRAFFDPKTGEVHGSGSGAGGGNPGEDYDSDAPAGSAPKAP
jgi:hypothetical protein